MFTKARNANVQSPVESGLNRPLVRHAGWPTSFRDLTRKFSNGQVKGCYPTNTNGRLPPELLDLVFQFLPRRSPSYGFQRSALLKESRGISRVCKSWYGPATRAIYEAIETRTFTSTVKLCRTLEKNTHLRPLVRTLLLPTRGRRCPPQVITVYLQILDLLDALDEVKVAIPYISSRASTWENDLPTELTKHGETLIALCIHQLGPRTVPSFPMIIQNFQQLRFIDLEGIRIDEHQLSTLPLPPPLLHLRVIAFTYWNAVKALDPWLLTCPNLMGLRFRRVFLKHEMSTLKVFSEGRITHLTFSSCLYWQITLPGWFTTAFANLRELECSTAIFASAWAYLPLTFDQLTLEVSSKHLGGVMEAITSYLAVATVKSLVLIVEKRNPWFQKNQYKLLQLCKVKSVIFEVDYLPYQYQSPLQHSLRNSWRKVANKVKELANEEALEVVRWESSPTAFDILMC